MTTRLCGLALSAALASGFAACGYPTFSYGTGGSTGAGAQGGGGSSASTTTASTTASSSSTASSTGGPTMCRLMHDAEDCMPGERCTIADESTGATKCAAIAAPPLAKWGACFLDMTSRDDLCPASTWCDHRTGVCMPFCTTKSQCGMGSCVGARGTGNELIPGANVCTANCEPVTAAPCADGATCTYDANLGKLDCFVSDGYGFGHSCMYLNDCGKGLVCAGMQCWRWCSPAGDFSSDCQSDLTCSTFSNLTVTYQNADYGFCD